MKKRLFIFGIVIVIAVAGVWAFNWSYTPPPGVTVENFKRLRQDMSEQGVEEILGQPGVEIREPILLEGATAAKCWTGLDCEIVIQFVKQNNYGNAPDELLAFMGACRTKTGSDFRLAINPNCRTGNLTFLDRIRGWLRI